jgi:signal transduction histidine kinase
MVGGKFRVESAPGKGTTVCAEIPRQDISPKNRTSPPQESP